MVSEMLTDRQLDALKRFGKEYKEEQIPENYQLTKLSLAPSGKPYTSFSGARVPSGIN